MTDVSRLLRRIEDGDRGAAAELLPMVYDELRRLAAKRMAEERPGHILQATALVHEAWLRLVGDSDPVRWNSRGHFFAAAATAMQRILVEAARRRRSQRSGGHLRRCELSAVEIGDDTFAPDVLDITLALDRLSERDPRAAQVVRLRFFAGLTMAEVAETLQVSVSTVENDWAWARSWLRLELSGRDQSESSV